MEKLFMTHADGIYTSPYAFNLRDIAPPHELSGGSQTNTEEPPQHNKRMAIQIKEQGMVLVIVLLLLMLTTIIGISVLYSSVTEAKIVGNERTYNQDFYIAESGIEYGLANSAIAMTSIGLTINGKYDYLTSSLPSFLSDTDISIKLTNITKPPVGSGYSTDNFNANYYHAASSKANQDIEVGIWKAFPK